MSPTTRRGITQVAITAGIAAVLAFLLTTVALLATHDITADL